MPYIKSNDGRRQALQNKEPAQNAGELNYQIFYYIKHNWTDDRTINRKCYLMTFTFVHNFIGINPNYQKYNDMTGVLIRCERELSRRLGFCPTFIREIMNSYDEEIADYEDLKIIENGDVE